MSRKTVNGKIAVMAVICSFLIAVRPVYAFVWPVIDLTEIVSFTNSISTGLNRITNAKSQLDNVTNTIKTIGDQVASVKKYAADLKGTITNIKDSVSTITDNIEETTDNVSGIVDDVNKELNGVGTAENENAETTVDSVNEQVDSGAPEEDVQTVVDEAKKESETVRENVNKTFDEADKAINESLDTANQALDMLVDSVNGDDGLSDEERAGFKQEAGNIKNDIDGLKDTSSDIIASAKADYNEQYSEKVAAAFDSYSQAVSDYYAGKTDREALNQAGEDFKNSVASLDAGIDQGVIDGLVANAQEIADKIDALEENMMNSISNSGDYSDGSEQMSFLGPQMQKKFVRSGKVYAFSFHSENLSFFLKGVYAEDGDKSFLLSKELACDNLDVADVEENPGKLRTCVVKAKTEKDLYPNAFKEELYKDYQKNGVYKHIIEDYSIANIVSLSKAKQFSATWGSLEPDDDSNKGTLYILRKTLKDVDNTRNGFALMGMTDIESPKLWSEIRRIDALNRAKAMAQDFERGTTLFLDGRDSEFVEATKRNLGTMQNDDLDANENKAVKGKAVFSNVILSICGLRAKDISVSEINKTDTASIAQKEKNLADCLFKYAEAASKGTSNGSAIGADTEAAKREWRDKQTKAYNDSAFNNLTLAVVNNYKSSLDYVDPKKLPDPDKDKNIVSMQDGLKESTTTKDDYAAGAQINYYSTQQILSIVDADAQNQQTEILKDLATFDYNYFGKTTGGEG